MFEFIPYGYTFEHCHVLKPIVYSGDESTSLIEPERQKLKVNESNKNSGTSTGRQWLLLMSLLILQCLTVSTDTFLLPFFTEKALDKQLNKIQVGAIFSIYNLGRFAGATFLVQKVSLI